MDELLAICHTFPPPEFSASHHKLTGYERLSPDKVNIIARASFRGLLCAFKFFHPSCDDDCFRNLGGYRGFAAPVLFKRLQVIMISFCFKQSFGQSWREVQVINLDGGRRDLTDLWRDDVVGELRRGIHPEKDRWVGYRGTRYDTDHEYLPYAVSMKEGFERFGVIVPELLAYHERKLAIENGENIAAAKLQRWWREVLCRPEYPSGRRPLDYLRASHSFQTLAHQVVEKGP